MWLCPLGLLGDNRCAAASGKVWRQRQLFTNRNNFQRKRLLSKLEIVQPPKRTNPCVKNLRWPRIDFESSGTTFCPGIIMLNLLNISVITWGNQGLRLYWIKSLFIDTGFQAFWTYLFPKICWKSLYPQNLFIFFPVAKKLFLNAATARFWVEKNGKLPTEWPFGYD